ncbi:CBS domain-containing protein [Natronobacterium gregoryi]|nr:CBS domain-containing protein [Natronobacterium gregoryi]AFZ72761.1 CBS domain-containing protein [Natronobacterium gregoryi SP2]PLK21183.1 CBS domain-containing protein [Natronobacterium gregoryi SP2]SFJ11443.1 CBS domain-containing protein [Natronobacterium gregoryi]
MHDTIPVAEVMVTDVVTAPPDANVTRAATLMRDESVSSVVVARDEIPVGILTEGDFATHLCERADLRDHELADVMSEPLETIAPETTIVEAVDVLRTDDLEHLPVVDDGELVGILTTTELSYYVPHLANQARHAKESDEKAGSLRRQVRTDTQYERDEWEFEYRGDDEETVSVGDVARFSKVLSSEDVEAFAESSGDTNRLHLDGGYAAETQFGERIVHGVLATGLISAALARLPGLTIYLSQESSFRAPLSTGDRATATCEIVERLGDDRYRIETTVTDGDDAVVLEGDAVVLIDELPPEPSAGTESATTD